MLGVQLCMPVVVTCDVEIEQARHCKRMVNLFYEDAGLEIIDTEN